jgi:hypothetical protein
MATNTWVALDKVTVGSATPSVTFTSIPATYTDLVIIVSGNGTTDQSYQLQFNGETTGTNYSATYMYGTGSGSGNTGRLVSDNGIAAMGRQSAGSTFGVSEIHILNYANTAIFKTVIGRGSNADVLTIGAVGTWRASAAISTILISPEDSGNINTGSTFSLYGILKEGTTPTPKASGGIIYSDDLYYYHVFASTGVFTPSQTVSGQYLVVAGGGGGGSNNTAGGGGGAGGYRSAMTGQLSGANSSPETPLSFVSGTNYTVTIGGGGNGGGSSAGSNGTASSIIGGAISVSSTGGGGGGQGNGVSGGAGGGGGGQTGGTTGAAGTSLQGFAGGNGLQTSVNYSAGGGGGAGSVGSNGVNQIGGAGGAGITANLYGVVTFAGGGGGGNTNDASGPQSVAGGAGGLGGGGNGGRGSNTFGQNGFAGTANTGGGGGGGGTHTGIQVYNGGAGGSGIVMIRYLKA